MESGKFIYPYFYYIDASIDEFEIEMWGKIEENTHLRVSRKNYILAENSEQFSIEFEDGDIFIAEKKKKDFANLFSPELLSTQDEFEKHYNIAKDWKQIFNCDELEILISEEYKFIELYSTGVEVKTADDIYRKEVILIAHKEMPRKSENYILEIDDAEVEEIAKGNDTDIFYLQRT